MEFSGRGFFYCKMHRLEKALESSGKSGSEMGILFSVMVCFGPRFLFIGYISCTDVGHFSPQVEREWPDQGTSALFMASSGHSFGAGGSLQKMFRCAVLKAFVLELIIPGFFLGFGPQNCLELPCSVQICQSGSFSEGHDLGIKCQCQCQV